MTKDELRQFLDEYYPTNPHEEQPHHFQEIYADLLFYCGKNDIEPPSKCMTGRWLKGLDGTPTRVRKGGKIYYSFIPPEKLKEDLKNQDRFGGTWKL